MGRNLLKFKKILMTSSLIRKYEVESPHCFIVSGWITLKFGVRGNFRLLISNHNSKMQYRFEIVRKCHFSSLKS